MFKKILYPTDFSTPSDKLLDCLDEVRPLGVEEVVLLHVTDVRQAADLLGFDSTYFERHDGLARGELQRRQEKVAAMGFRSKIVQVHDVPDKGIIHIAKQESCDLIFIGSQGKTLAKEVFLGSVSENVVRYAPLPVLLVKVHVIQNMGREVCEVACQRVLRKVLVPTDFSECASEALEVVRRLRAAGTEELILVHVQDVHKLLPHLASRMPEFNQVDTERLETLRQNLSSEGFRVRYRLMEGAPFQEILGVADEEDVGLIALCTHGRSAVKEVLLGSVAGRVIRRSRQPVLVIRSAKMCPPASTAAAH